MQHLPWSRTNCLEYEFTFIGVWCIAVRALCSCYFFAIKTGRRWMNSLHPLLPICWCAKQSSLIGLVIAPVISLPLSDSVSLISANLQWPMGTCTYVYPLLSRPASVPRSCHWWRTCSVSLQFHFLLVIERLTLRSTLSACFRAEDTAWIIRTNCTELRSYSSRVCRKAQHSTCMHSCCCLDFGVGTGIQAIMHSDTSYIATPTIFFLMSYKWSKSRFS
jgi:hypothetical protein